MAVTSDGLSDQVSGFIATKLVVESPAPTHHSLPYELWSRIFGYVLTSYNHCEPRILSGYKLGLLVICKGLKEIVWPLYYSRIRLSRISNLRAFEDSVVSEAITRPDGQDMVHPAFPVAIYSAPGRWVHTLDLSHLRLNGDHEVQETGASLTRLFPFLPLLTMLRLNPTIPFTSHIWGVLLRSDCVSRLRSLVGVTLRSSLASSEDELSFIQVLLRARSLEELDIVGPGLELSSNSQSDTTASEMFWSGDLPELIQLRKLALLSTHTSLVMNALLQASLPSICHLSMTPYDELSVPTTLVPQFIKTHGRKPSTLRLFSPKSWPTRLFPSPTTIFSTCPLLEFLFLEEPLPDMAICASSRHPLRELSIPRPNPKFLASLERHLSNLPNLKVVRVRDVRWLRGGLSERAQGAGVQGEMKEWGRRLTRRGIRLLDANGKEGTCPSLAS